ncbi:YaiO family outer membrane beta-barrel protein [Algoriphagus sp.]|uniref:YaiO family outer membrane beta-barrel protein n=1 Tax=Algoriphagus sp. TaxID=1872435 RepID=UPI002723687A|nr:YaiO family outer membrane beta-barrel protein [Algoriphagus sp.]MDO8966393.1 YaiO family outer membrane beta-barrel protein [Algoriphagus sp.]MDP3202340.1 YaiO family outer membrane beta-barrel protein [Algoriphagus sp.]
MKKLFIAVFSLLVSTHSLMAQDSFDPDELLLQARELIFSKKYIEGRKIAYRALDKYPNYADILILVGRSYAWEGKNDSANIYLERAIVASPTYSDGYVAYLDNLFWSENYTKADEILGRAKSSFGTSIPDEIIYRESRLFYYRELYKEAFELVNPLFKKGFKTEGMLGYMKNLERFRKVNAVGATYDYDTFEGAIEPWHTWSFYGRTRTKLTGALIARVTQSARFDNFGTLVELDAYPSIGKNGYAYLNVGGSGASFFPKFRFGGSYFHNLEKGWELEGGYRYLGFSAVTHIITGSVGKYTGNWWLNLRLNVIPDATLGASTSTQFTARYYFKTAEDFFSIQLGTGVSPDEETRDQSQLLNSYRARIGYQQLISPKFMIYGFTGYSRDELSTDNFRNNLNLSLGFEYRF